MTRFNSFHKGLIVGVALLSLAACGGSNGKDEDLLLSDAGEDQSILSYQETIALDGSFRSKSAKLKFESIRWRQTAGPENVDINNAKDFKASFVMPTQAGRYTFELKVVNLFDQTYTDSVDIVVTDKAANLAQLQGNWLRSGYGLYLQVSGENIDIFNQNDIDCLHISSAPYDEFITDPESLNFSSADQFSYQNNVFATKIATLNEACNNKNMAGYNSDPVLNFDYVWHQINELHAHLDRRNVNWPAIYEQYRPTVTPATTSEELLEIIADMLAEIGDAHMILASASGEQFEALSGLPKDSKLNEYIASESKDLEGFMTNTYIPAIDNYHEDGSIDYYYNTDSALPALGWGKTADNMGLLFINQMVFDSLEVLDSLLNQALSELKDTDGLIIDVRTNLGGSDSISLAIASFFTDTDIVAFRKYARNREGESPLRTVTVEPATDNIYLKPVYLLTSQSTGSAAEIFATTMEQLPHVTLVGEETQGALSDVLVNPLPMGAILGLSNEIYENHQGEVLEVTGIVPDVNVAAFSIEALESGIILTYEKALELAGKR